MANLPSERDETPRIDELVEFAGHGRTSQGLGEPDWLQPVLVWVARNWLFLAVGLIGGGVIGGYIAMSQPTRYVAEALIAPTRSRVQVQFESSIKTVSDAAAGTTGGTLAPAPPERLQSLTELVTSGTIEAQVIPQLSGAWTQTDLQPGEVVAHIHGALKPRSEIISIQADGADPAQAIALANTWATSYTSVVNRLYASANFTGTVQSMEAQRDDAFARHQAAQDALTSMIRSTRLEELRRAIKEKEDRLTMLYRGGLPPSNEAASTDASKTVPDASKTVPAPFGADDYRLVEVHRINDLAQTLRRLDTSRTRIQALASEASAGSTDTAAITLAKAQLVTISDALPAQMQFQVPPSTESDAKADLAQLLAAVESARTQIGSELAARQADYESKRAAEIGQLEDELRPMRSELEDLMSGQKELTLKRDLAWDTYIALARKLEERNVADAATGHEVELASTAVAANPAPRATTLSAVVGATLGLAAVVMVLLAWAAVPRIRQAPLTAARGGSPLPIG